MMVLAKQTVVWSKALAVATGPAPNPRCHDSPSPCRGDDPESNSMNAAPLPVDRVHRYASGRAGALVEAFSDAGPSLSRNES
ncbi:hypothetical protein ACS0PU_009339 [Formica fusca]